MKDIGIWPSELWLEVTEGEISEEDFQKQIKEKILESYHNGLDTKEYREQANAVQEESVKQSSSRQAKPRKFWPRQGRAER